MHSEQGHKSFLADLNTISNSVKNLSCHWFRTNDMSNISEYKHLQNQKKNKKGGKNTSVEGLQKIIATEAMLKA